MSEDQVTTEEVPGGDAPTPVAEGPDTTSPVQPEEVEGALRIPNADRGTTVVEPEASDEGAEINTEAEAEAEPEPAEPSIAEKRREKQREQVKNSRARINKKYGREAVAEAPEVPAAEGEDDGEETDTE